MQRLGNNVFKGEVLPNKNYIPVFALVSRNFMLQSMVWTSSIPNWTEKLRKVFFLFIEDMQN